MSHVHPMTLAYRCLLYYVVAMGLAAIAIGVAGLLELDLPYLTDEGSTRSEMWIAVTAGLGLIVFAGSALPHAKLTLAPGELRYLRFRPVCGTTVVPLDQITRFGTGVEKRGARRTAVLVMELADGTKRSVKLSMYRDWRKLVQQLGLALGQEPADTADGWTGVRLQ